MVVANGTVKAGHTDSASYKVAVGLLTEPLIPTDTVSIAGYSR